MENKQFIETLQELFSQIENDAKDFNNDINNVQNNIKLKDSLKQLASSMSTVRIGLQYLLFDLEATCRERDQLRVILEDKD